MKISSKLKKAMYQRRKETEILKGDLLYFVAIQMDADCYCLMFNDRTEAKHKYAEYTDCSANILYDKVTTLYGFWNEKKACVHKLSIQENKTYNDMKESNTIKF
tara:strand:- start:2967 stop:3278 length:312 start_codon:yes stop_codon:yes gene_type:complete